MKHFIMLLPLVAAAMLMTSCSKKTAETVTTSQVTNVAPATQAQMDKIVTLVNTTRNSSDQVTGRMNMELSAGKQKLSVGGNLKMKRDDVIQLSLQVFGFVEAGRMELTKDYFLILNRIGKQYVKASYKDVPFFKENGINFYTFQSLMWNELFLPELEEGMPTEADYTKTSEEGNILLTYNAKQYMLEFLATAANGVLQQTNIKPTKSNGKMEWKYTSWAHLGNSYFPDKMKIDVNAGTTKINISLELSRLRTDENWKETRTNLDKKKLKQISLQAAFSQIMSLSK